MPAKRIRKPKPVRGKVRVALIGAGAMANSVHYPSLVEIPGADIVGLCDLMPDKLKETAKRFKIKRTFSDYRQMIKATKPHAVYALMPPHHIYDVAMDVMEAGCHLFVEKPPAITVWQAECLARRAADLGLITGVGFQRRYHPLLQRCYREVMRKGRPNQVVTSFFKCMEPGPVHPYYRGAIDILSSDAIHAVDTMRFYAGGEPVAVHAEVSNLDSWYAMRFNALVKFDNGCTGVFMANWRAGARRLLMEMHTAGCSAYADADGEARIYRDNKPEPAKTMTYTQAAGKEERHHAQGFFAQARAFISAVKKGRTLHNDIADAARSMRLVERILAAGER